MTATRTSCWLTQLAQKVNTTQVQAVRDRLEQGRVKEVLDINHRINTVWRTCALTTKGR